MKEPKRITKISIRVILPILGISLLMVGMSAAVFSYAWFSTKTITSENITGTTAGAYFASGDGTKTDEEDKSYILNKPIHLYNLAWLQYMGVFNEASSEKDSDGKYITKTTYFRLEDDLDMSGYVLPPIGTEEHPFVGNFDGNNHAVSNVTISSEFSDFTKHPNSVTNENYVIPNIIGFFGIIGKLDDTYKYVPNSETNSVYDLYLDMVIVENGSNSTSILAGLLAGYVNGTLTTSGVYRGKFDFASGTTNIDSTKFTKVSNYSLIGSYNSDDYALDGDPDAGAGESYGTSTNLKQLYDDLDTLSETYSDFKDGTTMRIPKNYAVPFRRSSNIVIAPKNSSYSTQISNSSTENITASNYIQSASKNNIGYYVGSDIKLYHKTGVDYSTIKQFTFGSITDTLTDEELVKIQKYLTESHTDSSGSTYRQGDYLMRLTGVTQTFNVKDSLSIVESGNVSSAYSGKLLLPYRCVWVAPTKAGKFTFVMVSESNNFGWAADAMCVFKFTRNTKNDYSSYMYAGYSSTNTSDYLLGPMTCSSSVTSVTFNVSESDIANKVEYALGVDYNYRSTNTPYIAYMDIGANASGESEAEPTALNLDFVAAKNDNISEGLIKIGDDGYTKSGILFSISGSGDSSANQLFYFMRYVSSGVYYYYLSTNALSISVLKTDTGVAAEDTDGSKSKWD